MIPAGLLPEGASWCVAGGYAACPALSSDIDVWVFGVPSDQLEEKRAEWLAFFETRAHLRGWAVISSTEQLPDSEYQGLNVEILKVATVYVADERPVHLMVTNAPDPHSILAGFDVSTHQVAILPDGRVIKGPAFTAPHEAPVALFENSHTPDRMQRIAARFGHTLKGDQVPF